jgi:hypothetical protein
MRLQYGPYLFDENACSVRSNTRLVTAPETGRPLRYVTRASIDGWLEGDSQTDLAVREAALRTALLRPYQDLRFLTDNGVLTPLSLLNVNSISGVRVVDFSFPGGDGAEYATLRRFTAEVEAEFLVPGTENAILAFAEQVSYTGTGGPDVILRVPINSTRIVAQQVTPATPVYATQTGQAVGHVVRPRANPPKWGPAFEVGKQRQITAFGPKRIGRGYAEFGVQWAYFFQFPTPPAALHPTPPPL